LNRLIGLIHRNLFEKSFNYKIKVLKTKGSQNFVDNIFDQYRNLWQHKFVVFFFIRSAKKSRLKQKLVKSARSVAIFSLKLKERRQREAEKAATIAVEHAKVFIGG